MTLQPGTVSQILWHFTGGPLWDAEKNCQKKRPKPPSQAYKALIGILASKQLRIGSYKEVVKIRLPEFPVRNKETGEIEVVKNHVVELSSEPVNCIADIPAMHLNYHAQRYGKFAIGFRRQAAIRHGFNPVLYTLHGTSFLQSIYQGFARLEMINTQAINQTAHAIDEMVSEAKCSKGHLAAVDITHQLVDLYGMEVLIDAAFDMAKQFFGKSLAFIKTFHESEFGTIYCEREWRSVTPFDFIFEDIATILLPKNHFGAFMKKQAEKLGIPRSVPIQLWEDYVEH